MHPTVEHYKLKTYKARFTNKCSICRKPFELEQDIVMLTPDLLNLLNRLGMSTKVRKYAHLGCLPPVLPSDLLDPLKQAVNQLAATTDPNWPEDFIGFAKSEAGPCMRWMNLGYPPIGAHRIAKKLLRYIHTQLSEEVANSVRLAARYGDLLLDPKFTGGNPIPYTNTPVTPLPPAEIPDKSVTVEGPQPECDGPVVEAPKRKGAMFVELDGTTKLKIWLDPPWENQTHSKVKDLIKGNGARYNPADFTWSLSIPDFLKVLPVIVSIVKTFNVGPNVKELLSSAFDQIKLSNASSLPSTSEVAKELENAFPDDLKLKPYQEAGVAFIKAANGKALVGDMPGLGKTMQAIGYLAINPKLRPALIVCPAAVSVNWHRELWKWLPDSSVQRLKNSTDFINKTVDVTIVTYDLLQRVKEKLTKALPFKVVVLDEVQAVKNYKAKRTKAVIEVTTQTDSKVIALSGTPIVNRPAEFFTILHLLRPEIFSSWRKYAYRYCAAEATKYGLDARGSSNTAELSEKLRYVMIRRKKEDVLKELPPKTRRKLFIELTSEESNKIEEEVDRALASSSKEEGDSDAVVLQAITAARYCVGKIKVHYALQQIEEYLEQEVPLLVYAYHQDVLDELEKECSKLCKVVRVDGSVSQENRDRAITAFQNGQAKVLLVSVKTGVGFTAHKASYGLFVERAWTPGDEEQSEDRMHRIGQVNAVNIDYLVTDAWVDTKMDALIDNKREVLQAVLDGKAPPAEELDIRKELINAFLKERR